MLHSISQVKSIYKDKKPTTHKNPTNLQPSELPSAQNLHWDRFNTLRTY